jgi:hypothetical protein
MRIIQIFVNIWPGRYKEGQKIVDDLIANGYKNVVAIVSGREVKIIAPKVYYLSRDAYFGEQFVQIINLFKGDILIQIQADVEVKDYRKLIDCCIENFDLNPNLGIWAPDIDYTSWITAINTKKIRQNKITKEFRTHHGMIEVLNTDCTLWALKKEIIYEMTFLNLRTIKFGWGLDLVASAICRSRNLKVMRNVNFRVNHPKGTGYNEVNAANEWKKLRSSLPWRIKINLLVNQLYLIRNKALYLSKINIKRIIGI